MRRTYLYETSINIRNKRLKYIKDEIWKANPQFLIPFSLLLSQNDSKKFSQMESHTKFNVTVFHIFSIQFMIIMISFFGQVSGYMIPIHKNYHESNNRQSQNV